MKIPVRGVSENLTKGASKPFEAIYASSKSNKPDSPDPLIVILHGGPHSVSLSSFSKSSAFLSLLGYSLLFVNYREGLSTRSAAYGGSFFDEIQFRIEPDFDDQVTGLCGQVRRLRDVAQEIETEAKGQNEFLNQLQMTLIKAQAGVKNNVRRLNKSIIREGSSHVMHVVLFALILFFVIYMLSKFTRR